MKRSRSLTNAVYYFLTDVFPPMNDGYRPLDPPGWWIRIFEGRRDSGEDATTHEDVDEVRLGGGMAGQQDLPAAPEVR